MSTDVRDNLRRLAHEWDGMHPPITAEEVFSRFEKGIPTSEVETTVVAVSELEDGLRDPPRGRPRPRPRRVLIYGSAAATLVTGFIVIGATRTAGPVHDTPPTPASTAPGSSESASSEPAMSEPAVSESAPSSPAIPTSSPSIAGTTTVSPSDIAEVRESIVGALAALDSFRATYVNRSYRAHPDGTISDDITTTTTVTWMGDGRVWFEGGNATWGSFDPSTGALMRQFIGPDGADHYQRTDGRSYGLSALFGHEPVTDASFSDASTVETVDFLDRPAWKIDAIHPLPQSSPEIIVDTATGLTVALEDVFHETDGTTTHLDSKFSSLETGVDLPAEFPGVFPEGVVIEEPRVPTADSSGMGLPEAAATFGRPFYAPADLPATAKIRASSFVNAPQDPVTVVHGVNIAIPIGFTWASVAISDVVTADQPPTNSSVPVEPTAPGVLSGGALAGQSYEARDTEIHLVYSGLDITIVAGTLDIAMELANSMVLVPL